MWPELLELEGDRGAKSILALRPDDVATLFFRRGAIDLDTPEDWQRWRED